MMTTVTTVTTVTAMATLGLTTIIGVVAAITLLSFLMMRELASTKRSGTAMQVAKFSGVGILPLIMAFAAAFIVEITKVL